MRTGRPSCAVLVLAWLLLCPRCMAAQAPEGSGRAVEPERVVVGTFTCAAHRAHDGAELARATQDALTTEFADSQGFVVVPAADVERIAVERDLARPLTHEGWRQIAEAADADSFIEGSISISRSLPNGEQRAVVRLTATLADAVTGQIVSREAHTGDANGGSDPTAAAIRSAASGLARSFAEHRRPIGWLSFPGARGYPQPALHPHGLWRGGRGQKRHDLHGGYGRTVSRNGASRDRI